MANCYVIKYDEDRRIFGFLLPEIDRQSPPLEGTLDTLLKANATIDGKSLKWTMA